MAFLKCINIPDGKTALPLNDVQTWLHCAAIYNTSYNTVSQVLNDSSTLQTVCKNHNATDYIARCSSSFYGSVLANANARQYWGSENYCFEALWAASAAWRSAISSNDRTTNYMLNVKVPVMTSDTTPSGQCSASSVRNSTYAAWKAFDNNESTLWLASTQIAVGSTGSGNLTYDFGSAKRILACYFTDTVHSEVTAMRVRRKSSSSDSWTNVTSDAATYNQEWQTTTAYRYWNFVVTQKNVYTTTIYCPRISTCQFLGRVNV